MASVRAMIRVSPLARASAIARILPAISAHGIKEFIREMPAALGVALVLKLKGAGTCAFIGAHCSLGIQSVAEAGISINDHG